MFAIFFKISRIRSLFCGFCLIFCFSGLNKSLVESPGFFWIMPIISDSDRIVDSTMDFDERPSTLARFKGASLRSELFLFLILNESAENFWSSLGSNFSLLGSSSSDKSLSKGFSSDSSSAISTFFPFSSFCNSFPA
eukprot:NODE_100_length_20331_cov_1.214462.p18 type:complete len:137 gc:universal NODE_100_length_20331_cov_1.214462:6325-6735(+)